MDNSSEPHSPLNEEFAKLRKFLIFIYLRPGPQIVKELEAYFCLSSDYFPQPFPCQIRYTWFPLDAICKYLRRFAISVLI